MLKPRYSADDCLLLLAPAPIVNIFGVCNTKLMFFETPRTISVTNTSESSKFGLVKVTQGTLTEEQVCQQLRRLVSKSLH